MEKNKLGSNEEKLVTNGNICVIIWYNVRKPNKVTNTEVSSSYCVQETKGITFHSSDSIK